MRQGVADSLDGGEKPGEDGALRGRNVDLGYQWRGLPWADGLCVSVDRRIAILAGV